MSHQVIKQPNGRYCVFSSIVDNFILINCTKQDLVDYYMEKETENVKNAVDRMVSRAEGKTPPNQFTKTYDEALKFIGEIHGKEELDRLKEKYGL